MSDQECLRLQRNGYKTMSIAEIMSQKENVLLVVSLDDLKELFNSLLDERDAERQAISESQHNEELVSADETATILGVQRNSLWRWAKSGYLVPVKIGRTCYYKRGDIDRLKQSRI